MKITNVNEIKDDNGGIINYEIHANCNGMDFYYFLNDTLHTLFSKDLETIRKTFFANEYVDWSDCMSYDDALDVIGNLNFIKCIDLDARIEKRDQDYINMSISQNGSDVNE